MLGLAGAGKTSLLAAIAGLLPARNGAVFRGGEDVSGLRDARRGIAMLPPGTTLDGAGSVQAALRRLAGRGGAAPEGDRLSALGLADRGARRAGTLSHGQAAMALTAARLLPEGGALLVDEAGTGLDDEALETLSALLRMEAPRNASAARLTGPANIFNGGVRELRPGGFVWSAGGRYVQSIDAETLRPTLGNAVTLCLRPERIVLLGAGQPAENEAEAAIIEVRSAGGSLDIFATARLGPLQLRVPSWGTSPYPAAGQVVRLGWAADAAQVLG